MNPLLRRTTFLVSAGLLAAVATAGLVSPLSAQETRGQTKTLVKQLTDESFDVRRAAREKLFKMGQPAIPALTAAAQDRTSEAGYSAVRILGRMMKERVGPDSKAAKKALAELATGEDAIARQAREFLEEMQRQPEKQERRLGGMPGLRQFQLGGNGVGLGSSPQTMIVNGVQETTVKEPGRTIELTRDPNGPVSITVTDQGKKPKTSTADTLEALKKKDPKAFELFQQYGSNRAMRMAVPGLIMDDMMAMPPMMDPFQVMEALDPFNRNRRQRQAPQVQKEVQDADMLLEDMADLLKSLKKKSDAPEVRRLELKLGALKRNMDRIRQKTGQ